MNVRLSEEIKKEIEKIKKRDSKLASKIEKKLVIFSINPNHPSLRIHKLSGNLKNYYSISITQGFRMTYILSDDEAHFTKLGTHDEVYSS